MAGPDTIAQFLLQRLHYAPSEGLARLDRLAGRQVGDVAFFADLAEARANLAPWMPLFCLPVASAELPLALHLRPGDVRAQRLAFVAGDPGRFIERALSPQQLAYEALLVKEAFGKHRNRPAPDLPDAVAQANEVFGPSFYEVGRHGDYHSGDEPDILAQVFGGTPQALRSMALFADDPAERLKLYERGIALGAEALCLYAGAARVLLEQGERRRAAEHAARSLKCYHHTAYELDIDDYFEQVRPLQAEFPDLFDEDATWQLQEDDPREWARRAGDLFKTGQVERADKLLNDLCHGTGDYDAAVGAFRRHYAALGWDWALALCELRS